MDIALLLCLIVLNGVFAMSEIAVVSSRRARLQNLADDGSIGAQAALSLHHDPTGFLSTIQVGITTIGILSGAIGEATLADPLADWLIRFEPVAPYAHGIALALTVVALTYVSVVVGELVPKRLALLAPEGIAALVAQPMQILARAAHPVVVVLSASGSVLLHLMGARRRAEPPVTDDEIKVLMEQGAEAGVFHESEQEIVSNVLRLDEQPIAAIMTPRLDMDVVDLDDGIDAVRRQIAESAHSRLVICHGGLERILGILQTGDLLRRALPGHPIEVADIEALLHPPLYVPESASTTQLLENFRGERLKFALIVNEYGDVRGLVTLADVLESIVGELSMSSSPEERDVMQREDGSWLVDGDVSVERVKAVLDIGEDLPGEDARSFHTLGGFVMHALGRVPAPADHFDAAGFRFEVMDMDRKRVDKVLIARCEPASAADGEAS
jgi:putative hemolysin